MFSFFKNVIKSREEWLNKPSTIPNVAAYLNTNTKTTAK